METTSGGCVTVHGMHLKFTDAPNLTVALWLGDQMIMLFFFAATNTVTDILIAHIFGSLSCTWIEGYEGFQDPHKAKWLSTRIVSVYIHRWSALKGFFPRPCTVLFAVFINKSCRVNS